MQSGFDSTIRGQHNNLLPAKIIERSSAFTKTQVGRVETIHHNLSLVGLPATAHYKLMI